MLSAKLKNGSRKAPHWGIGLAIALTFGLGCAEDTSIRIYSVSKSERGSRTVSTAQPAAASSSKMQQMLGAIIPNQDLAWFFKLTGAPEVVEKNEAQFRSIVSSVKFAESGEPTWQLSEGWEQKLTPGEITYCRLTKSADGLAATVSGFPRRDNKSEEGWREYVIDNVNRWRGQLSLADDQTWDEMQKEVEVVPELSEGQAKAFYISLVGRGSGGMSSAPFMSSARSNSPPPAEQAELVEDNPASNQGPTPPNSIAAIDASGKADPSELAYDIPANWTEQSASGMRKAAFLVGEDAADGEVTIIAAGGNIDDNMKMWMAQASLEPTDDGKQQILDAATEVDVNGSAVKIYELLGEKAVDTQVDATSILIAEIPWQSNQSLFVKLKGKAQRVADEKENFVKFVQSIAW